MLQLQWEAFNSIAFSCCCPKCLAICSKGWGLLGEEELHRQREEEKKSRPKHYEDYLRVGRLYSMSGNLANEWINLGEIGLIVFSPCIEFFFYLGRLRTRFSPFGAKEKDTHLRSLSCEKSVLPSQLDMQRYIPKASFFGRISFFFSLSLSVQNLWPKATLTFLSVGAEQREFRKHFLSTFLNSQILASSGWAFQITSAKPNPYTIGTFLFLSKFRLHLKLIGQGRYYEAKRPTERVHCFGKLPLKWS